MVMPYVSVNVPASTEKVVIPKPPTGQICIRVLAIAAGGVAIQLRDGTDSITGPGGFPFYYTISNLYPYGLLLTNELRIFAGSVVSGFILYEVI